MYVAANMAFFSFKVNNQKEGQTYLLQSLVTKKFVFVNNFKWLDFQVQNYATFGSVTE